MVSSHEEMLKKVMDNVTETLTGNLREVLTTTLEREVTTSLTKALVESEFYRRISKDMRTGLKRIHKEIQSAAKNAPSAEATVSTDKAQADKLFTEASTQLAQVLAATEQATVDIMDVVEKQMDLQAEAASLIEQARAGNDVEGALARLAALNTLLNDDMSSIMTSLSFQDITGQRIKKIVTALTAIEDTVVELYLSTGLLMKAREEKPEKDIDEIQRETEQTVSELKGPVTGVTQENIDDLLAQLGM